MKTHMLGPWVLAIILSVAFLGHTLARPTEASYPTLHVVCDTPNAEPFGHADGCPQVGNLRQSKVVEINQCLKTRLGLQCKNKEKFDVTKYHCPLCNQLVREESTVVNPCTSHNVVWSKVVKPPSASPS
jgi:hypothetical protein